MALSDIQIRNAKPKDDKNAKIPFWEPPDFIVGTRNYF